MLNQVFKVFSGTCQQFVEDGVKISNIFGPSNFTKLLVVYQHYSWGGNLCVYT